MIFQVRLGECGEAFNVGPDETILSAALRAKIALVHDCQAGGCGTCRVKLLEGAVSYVEFPLALTEQEHCEGYALACQARPQCDLVIEASHGAETVPAPARRIATVVRIETLSPSVSHLVLQIHGSDPLDFRPGQYMNVLLPDGGTRSFSMASKPPDNVVDFHVRRLPGGRFTDARFAGLREGDALEVELPLGSFYFRRQDYRPLLMVATGTGLAPIKAILDLLHDDPDCPPVSLYWGTRTVADLYWHDRIATWRDRLYEFKYIPVLSRADAGWNGRRGYVKDSILADFADLSECAIYLCGSPEMIASAKQAFVDRGASLQHIYTEGFVQSGGIA